MSCSDKYSAIISTAHQETVDGKDGNKVSNPEVGGGEKHYQTHCDRAILEASAERGVIRCFAQTGDLGLPCAERLAGLTLRARISVRRYRSVQSLRIVMCLYSALRTNEPNRTREANDWNYQGRGGHRER